MKKHIVSSEVLWPTTILQMDSTLVQMEEMAEALVRSFNLDYA